MSSPASTRTPLPEGTIPVAAALLIAGVATYAFFKVGTWAVGGEDEFSPISSLWFAMFALAPGFFLPLEQELGRALAHRRAIGQGGRPVVAKVGRLSLVLLAIVVLAILALSPLIATNYFDGEWVMLFALIVGFSAYAPVHLARGICSGSGRFREYAIVMGSDGVVRIVLCVAARRHRRHGRRRLRLRRRPRPARRPHVGVHASRPAHRSRARRRRGPR